MIKLIYIIAACAVLFQARVAADRQQCIEIYSKVEYKISFMSVLQGVDKTSHSVNRVLFGVFDDFLIYFEEQFNQIDEMNPPVDKSTRDLLRTVIKEIITEFEARERRTYAAVAFEQRGKVPLSIDEKMDAITNSAGDDWLNDEVKPLEDGSQLISAESKIKLDQSLEHFKKTSGWFSAPVETNEAMVDENAIDATPLKMSAITKRVKKIISKIKDVYHKAFLELLDVCDQSVLGLAAIIDVYEAHAKGNLIKPLKEFDYSIFHKPAQNIYSNAQKRKVAQAAEDLKRAITRQYFSSEVVARLEAKKKPPQDVTGIQFVSQIRTTFYNKEFRPNAKSQGEVTI